MDGFGRGLRVLPHSALEVRAQWWATSLENWTVRKCEGSTPCASAHCASANGELAEWPCGVTAKRLVLSRDTGVQFSAGLPTGCGPAARPPVLGTDYREFESLHPDQPLAVSTLGERTRPLPGTEVSSNLTLPAMARWPTGQAAVCNTVQARSNPVAPTNRIKLNGEQLA